MNTKQWTPALIASLLAFGSAQAIAGSGWYYDEDRDTIVYNVEGGRTNYTRTNAFTEAPVLDSNQSHLSP